MTIHEVITKVSQALSNDSDIQKQISFYLINSMDDDGEFTRSRYQKRPEGIIPDRELGPVSYILCGCVQEFHPSQLQYITDENIGLSNLTDFQAEIIWNKNIQNLREDKDLLMQTGYKYITTIIIKRSRYTNGYSI